MASSMKKLDPSPELMLLVGPSGQWYYQHDIRPGVASKRGHGKVWDKQKLQAPPPPPRRCWEESAEVPGLPTSRAAAFLARREELETKMQAEMAAVREQVSLIQAAVAKESPVIVPLEPKGLKMRRRQPGPQVPLHRVPRRTRPALSASLSPSLSLVQRPSAPEAQIMAGRVFGFLQAAWFDPGQ
eukprot:CAMPEP_0204277768 /NCGR_PEP_ID=MMETSP0468-20130131/29495_1 /ASSEMBLY_ACC=CAM_ASM_000383 /TAXON_ID=2969 /ORGANISM="Oxyrrhis marina" /LENGTH=184 /DNA_ID=CAMNT_0051254601 /DNA_START=46 /DNA_END=601 /DNA_ORIENTATION=-